MADPDLIQQALAAQQALGSNPQALALAQPQAPAGLDPLALQDQAGQALARMQGSPTQPPAIPAGPPNLGILQGTDAPITPRPDAVAPPAPPTAPSPKSTPGGDAGVVASGTVKRDAAIEQADAGAAAEREGVQAGADAKSDKAVAQQVVGTDYTAKAEALGAQADAELTKANASRTEAEGAVTAAIKERDALPPPADQRSVGQKVLGFFALALGSLAQAQTGDASHVQRVQAMLDESLNKDLEQQQRNIDSADQKVNRAGAQVKLFGDKAKDVAAARVLDENRLLQQYKVGLEQADLAAAGPEAQAAAQQMAANIDQRIANNKVALYQGAVEHASSRIQDNVNSKRAAAATIGSARIHADASKYSTDANIAAQMDAHQKDLEVAAAKAAKGQLNVGDTVAGGAVVTDPGRFKTATPEMLNKLTESTVSGEKLDQTIARFQEADRLAKGPDGSRYVGKIAAMRKAAYATLIPTMTQLEKSGALDDGATKAAEAQLGGGDPSNWTESSSKILDDIQRGKDRLTYRNMELLGLRPDVKILGRVAMSNEQRSGIHAPNQPGTRPPPGVAQPTKGIEPGSFLDNLGRGFTGPQ